MERMENSHTYTQPTNNNKKKNNKLWCCANSAIELVDTVKTHKHNKQKWIKQLPETTQQMVVEIFLQKKNPNKHKIEKTQMKKWLRNLTASGRFEKALNKQRRRLKVVPYEGGDEKTETNAHVIERKGKW